MLRTATACAHRAAGGTGTFPALIAHFARRGEPDAWLPGPLLPSSWRARLFPFYFALYLCCFTRRFQLSKLLLLISYYFFPSVSLIVSIFLCLSRSIATSIYLCLSSFVGLFL